MASPRALLVVVFAAACWKVDAANGTLQCNPNGSRACPFGYHCATDGTCWHDGQNPGGPKHRGDPCLPADSCDTGQCVDGYCCDSACGDPCSACNVSGLLGICSPVPVGMAPVHSTCNLQDVSSCGRDGLCDGAGMCELWPAGTACVAGSCAAGRATPPSRCSGAGACVPAATVDCDPYVCRPDGTACFDSCTDSTQCLAPNPCNTSGSCGPKSLGGSCANGTDCKSGNCADGVCCDMPQSACNGCQACNVTGSEGHCTNATVGTDPHNACPVSSCGNKCDGNGACRPAPARTLCAGTGTCTNGPNIIFGQYQSASVTGRLCDGVSVGSCPGTSSISCNPMTCTTDLTACRSQCGVDADCLYGNFCSAGQCLGIKPYNSDCTRDFECSHRVCVNGKCLECRTSEDCVYASGDVCDTATHHCNACTSSPECSAAGRGNTCMGSSPLYCACTDSSQCTNPSAPRCTNTGGPEYCLCGMNNVCLPGLICSDNTTSGTCKVRTGFPCVTNTVCFSGVCSNGVCG
jgi:Dickkopf N-terminal cysteine-rich region